MTRTKTMASNFKAKVRTVLCDTREKRLRMRAYQIVFKEFERVSV
jgi:hypothetical protein